ncbi:MAG: FmdB family zinc ribbon protein, partial [Planctomyces sp.]
QFLGASPPMPTYVYGVILSAEDDEAVGDVFEVEQSIHDPPLTHHPETGEPVRRLICAPFIAGTWSPLRAKQLLSDRNLAKRGLTKYVRTSSGYEKTTGKGPDLLPRE